MALALNYCQMVNSTPQNINSNYAQLSTSTKRLAISLWVNFAVNDTANMAIKELMRADIASLQKEICDNHNRTFLDKLNKKTTGTQTKEPLVEPLKPVQSKVAVVEKIIAQTQEQHKNILNAREYAQEHPNFDYAFKFEINYTGAAKITGEAYAINKLKFCGQEANFEFKNGLPTLANDLYPHAKIINEHHEAKAGSIFYTYEVDFDNQATSDIKYTATFDSLDFDITSFKISYARTNSLGRLIDLD